MRTSILSITALWLLVSITACTTSKLNQDDVMPPEQGRKQAIEQTTSSLRLTLSTEQESYSVGEPVYITATLKNLSKETIKVFRYLRPGEGALELSIQGGDRKNQNFVPLEEADHDQTANILLGDNQEIAEAFPVFFGGHGWSFLTNGSYTLTAIYRSKGPNDRFFTTKSAPLKITITGRTNEAVMNMVSGTKASYQSGLFLTWQAGDHLTQGQELLGSVLKSQSPITNYINLAYGKSYSEPFMDYRKPSPRQADCQLAQRYLSEVQLEELPTYLKIQYHLAMIRCNYNNEVQNKKITLEHFAQIEALTRNKIAYNSLMDRVKKMKSRVK